MKRIITMKARLLFAATVFQVVLKPSMAVAHLVTTGMGPVYDGIGHLLLTPEDLVPAMAVALYAGMRGTAPGRRTLFLFPLAWLMGGFIGLFIGGQSVVWLPALSFIVLGALISADLRLPTNGFTLLTLAVGLVHGFFNGVALKQGAGALGLIGIMTVLFILIALISAFVVSLKRPWTRIVVRVSGSWMVAIGMLMIGWLARGIG